MKRGGRIKRKTRLKPISAKRAAALKEAGPEFEAARDRARGRCERCGDRPRHLEVHHIWSRGRVGPHKAWNFAALCPPCHFKITYGMCVDAYAWLASSEAEARGIRAALDR